MSKYWIDTEKSNLALAESDLNRAVARLWEEEYNLILKNNTPVDASTCASAKKTSPYRVMDS